MTTLTNSCGSLMGGLRSVVLYDAEEVAFFGLEPESGAFTRASLAPLATPLEVAVADGGARYLERLTSTGEVEHRLELTVAGFTPCRVAQLASMSRRGVVAILTLTSGDSWVVGYSRRGGADYPLRLLGAEAVSCAKRAQMPTTTIVLGSVDGWVATPLVGQ